MQIKYCYPVQNQNSLRLSIPIYLHHRNKVISIKQNTLKSRVGNTNYQQNDELKNTFAHLTR